MLCKLWGVRPGYLVVFVRLCFERSKIVLNFLSWSRQTRCNSFKQSWSPNSSESRFIQKHFDRSEFTETIYFEEILSHYYTIKTQRKVRNAPCRGLWVPWAGSLWHKRAGVATQRSRPIRAQYLDGSQPMQWECSTLKFLLKNFSPANIWYL